MFIIDPSIINIHKIIHIYSNIHMPEIENTLIDNKHALICIDLIYHL
jgi:hypothetical protein